MAKNANSKNWQLTAQWDGRRYSESADIPTFTAPSSLATSLDTTDITITWTNGTASASTIIERSFTGTSDWTPIATKTPGTTSHVDAGLAAGSYYYRARHVLNDTYTSYSNSDSETITYIPPVVDGDEVTVTIAGAGSNVPASNFSFLGGSYGPVEAGTVGNLFTTIAPVGWDMPGGTGTLISNTETLNGTRSLLHDRSRGFQFGFAYKTGGIRRVGFARWSFLFLNPNNLGDDVVGGQLKQVRFVGGTGARLEDSAYANTYITGWTGRGGVYAVRNDSPSAGTNLSGGSGREWHKESEWITVHYRVTDSSAAGVADASIQIMTIRESDGTVLGTWVQNNVLLRTAAEALIRHVAFQFYMGNAFNTTSGCMLYLDRDIACAYSDTTTPPKYIMLGNASTWSACTIRTYCEWTSWVDNGASSDITIKVNQGRHSSLTGLYVYAMSDAGTVINSTGVALS